MHLRGAPCTTTCSTMTTFDSNTAHLPHSSRLDPNFGDGSGCRYREVPRIGDLDGPTSKLSSVHLGKLVDERVRNLALRVFGCRGVGIRRRFCFQICEQRFAWGVATLTAGEDIELLTRKLVPIRQTRPEVFGDNFFGSMCQPIRQLKFGQTGLRIGVYSSRTEKVDSSLKSPLSKIYE